MIIAPSRTNWSWIETAAPSTTGTIPPAGSSLRPVAVTMMSASSRAPGLHADALGHDRVDVIGDHFGLTRFDGREKVPVRSDADALIRDVVQWV